MCEFLDRLEEKGKIEKAKEMATILFDQGVAMDVIARAAGVTEKEIEDWLELRTTLV